MKATDDKEIINELNMEFATLDDKKPDIASNVFLGIAKKLFCEYQIVKGNSTKYDLEEIEFYLYTSQHKDNNHVYPRVCQAGEWFVHYSGVDLTFQTLTDGKKITQCGGILFRRLKKSEINGSDDGYVSVESIGGPLRCLMELFNGQDAPKLIKKNPESVTLESSHRIGIKNRGVQDTLRYRFYTNANPDIKTESPQYTKEGIIEIKDKKYRYDPK